MDKNIQMTQRDTSNTAWDNIFPITKAGNVKTTSNSDVETELGKKVNKAGDTMTGTLALGGTKELQISTWGAISSGNGGKFLIGQNCYTSDGGTTFKYANTHASLGARGILFDWGTTDKNGTVWFFDMGAIATTADATFTPTLKKMWNEGNDGSGSGLDADYLKGLGVSANYNTTGTWIPQMVYNAPFEVPQWIDFHNIGSTADYDGRIYLGASKELRYMSSTLGDVYVVTEKHNPVIQSDTGKRYYLKHDANGLYLQEV